MFYTIYMEEAEALWSRMAIPDQGQRNENMPELFQSADNPLCKERKLFSIS